MVLHEYICMCIRVCVRVCMYLRACVCANVYACMCVCVCARVFVCSLSNEFLFHTDNLSRSDRARNRRDGLAGEDVEASIGLPLRRQRRRHSPGKHCSILAHMKC